MGTLSGKRVAVIGASEGLGREFVRAARAEGAEVLAVARRPQPLEQLAREEPGTHTLALDAAADDAPERVFEVATPDVLVVCGGARPTMAPVQQQTWDEFSRNWNTDLKASFDFCTAALRKPLAPGSVVVLISSGAGLGGSQMSGGYAGAKRMQMFLAEYCQDQSDRLGLGIRFITIVPARIMAATGMGKAAIAGYSAYYGITPEQFMARMDGAQTTAQVADAFVTLVTEREPREGNVFAVSARGTEAVP